MSLLQQQHYVLGTTYGVVASQTNKKSTWTHRHFFIFFSKGAFEVLFFFFCFCCCHLAWLHPPPALIIPETLNTHTPRLGIKGLLAESEAQSLEQKRAPKNNISKLWWGNLVDVQFRNFFKREKISWMERTKRQMLIRNLTPGSSPKKVCSYKKKMKMGKPPCVASALEKKINRQISLSATDRENRIVKTNFLFSNRGGTSLPHK